MKLREMWHTLVGRHDAQTTLKSMVGSRRRP